MSLVAHWQLEGDASDSLGEHDGYPQSAVYGNGKLGDCYDNTANDAGGVELIRHDDFTEYEDYYSFSLWFKSTTETGGEKSRILSRDGSEYPTFNIDQDDSSPQNLRVYQAAAPNTNVTVNEWHHFAMTIDTGANESRVFIDGQLDNTSGVSSTNLARPYVIGGNTEGDGENLSGSFEGKIDDVRLYDHVLSEKEVKQLSQAKVLHYKMNDSEAVTDASGQENDGTNNGATFSESSAVGSGSYSFDGSDDYIYYPLGNLPQEYTVSNWVKTTASSASISSFNESLPSGGSHEKEMYVNSGIPYFRAYDGSEVFVSGSNRVDDGNWHHIVVTAKDNDVIRLYVDGEQVDSNGSVGDLYTGYSTGYYILGTSEESSYLDGLIADSRVYQERLSSTEIQSLYENRASIDDQGGVHGHEVEEPKERNVINDKEFAVSSNDYSALTIETPIDTDLSNWVESDDTLGNVFLEGWIEITDTEFYPTVFEYTNKNNDEGFYMNSNNSSTIQKPDNWNIGWNYLLMPVNTYESPSVTDWSNQDRLEIYRSGPSAGDTSQSIRFKNLKLRKFTDNETQGVGINKTGIIRQNSANEVGPAPENLVGWWPLDGHTRDLSENGNDGTNNGASKTGGLGQGAYDFTFADDDNIAVDAPSGSGLQFGGDITYSFWLYHTSPLDVDGSNNFRRIVNYQSNRSSVILEESKSINFSVNIDGSRANIRTGEIKLDQWNHITCTYNSDTDTSTIYVNGSSIGSTGVTTGTREPTNETFVISNNGHPVDGKIQDVRIYDRALTESEVAQLKNMTDPREKERAKQTSDGTVIARQDFTENL